MALLPVQKRQAQGKAPGPSQTLGMKVGRGLGAITGGVAGGLAGIPGGPAGIVAGSMGGATGGASFGNMVGGAIDPQKAGQAPTQTSSVPTLQAARNSQVILDGLRSLEGMDKELQQEYAQPLTQAYIASMIDLKQRGNA